MRTVRKGCQAYLASIMDMSKISLAPIDMNVVQIFVDVFLKDLSDILLKWEIEFAINLMLGTISILKMSYHMALN